MNFYSYKMDHDYGFAPNPFGGYCTLANCKSDIRKNKKLKEGDWIIGIGSAKLKLLDHLIHAMQVSEKLTFDQYWDDPRFQYKKPMLNGSLVEIYGDNIYHTDKDDKWIQEDSAHSTVNGEKNHSHTDRDTCGKYVLIATNFYYFGDGAVLIPEQYRDVCSKGRSMKSIGIPIETGKQFIDWLQTNHKTGIHGDPINWKEHFRKKEK